MIKKWLLRGLCILGLSLLPISFSNASSLTGSVPGTIYNTIYGNYPYTYYFDQYLNINSNNEINGLFYVYGGSSPTGPRTWILFRNNGKLAGYGNIKTSGTQKIIKEGYYSKYCSSNVSDYLSTCTPVQTDGFGGNYTTDMTQFYRLGAIYDDVYFDTSSNGVSPFVCFISNTRNIVSCFMMNITNNDGVFGDLNQFLSGSSILTTISVVPSDFNQSKFGSSPFVSAGYGGDAVGGGTIVGGEANGITNKVVINGYENIGFSSYLCYGGVLRNDYSSFIPGTGSTIFQLYNQYGDGFSAIGQWYNYYRQGYRQYPAINISGSVFIIDGVFKMPLYGLFYLGSYYGGSSLKTSDIINYCDLLLNHNNNYAYTGSQDISDILQGAIQNNIINNNYYWYSGNQQIYPTGAIAHLSGENLNWDGRSFFEKLSDKFANAFPAPSGDYSGFIPGYILVFMFALIFIRILHK